MKLRKRDLFLLVAAPALLLGAIGTVGTVSNKVNEVKAAVSGTATYTVASTSSVNSSGTKPTGSTATFVNTYTNKNQISNKKSATLTLSGYDGLYVTGITMSMKSNQSNGSGSCTITVGSTTIATTNGGKAFNEFFDSTSFSTTYKTVTPTLTNDYPVVGKNEDIVITITNTNKSLYIESYSISWSDTQPSTSNEKTISFDMKGGTLSANYDNPKTVTENFNLPSASDVTADPYNGKSQLKEWKLGNTAYNPGAEVSFSNISGTSATITAVWEQVGETISIEDAIGVAGIAGGNNSVCTFTTIGVVTEVGSTVLTMKDPADENKTIKVYGSNLSTNYSVGSKIKVTGLLYMAGTNNDTPAFKSGATIEDLTPSISLSADATTVFFGDTEQGDATGSEITAVPHLFEAPITWTITEGSNLIETMEDGASFMVFPASELTTGGDVTVKASATVEGQLVEKTINLKIVKKEQLSAATNLSWDNATHMLSWDAVANATSYKVTVKTGAGADTTYTATETTNTYLELENLVSGDYKFKVEAFGTDSTYVEYLSSASDFANFHLTVMVKALIENIMPTANLGFSYNGYENAFTAENPSNDSQYNTNNTDVAAKIGIGDNFTAKVNKGSASYGVGLNKQAEIRLYSSGSTGSMLIIEPTDGRNISTVDIVCSAGAGGLSVGNDIDNLTTYVEGTNDNGTYTFPVYSGAFFIRNTGSSRLDITTVTIHTINVTNVSDVSMKFRASISDDIYSNIENITAVGARLSVVGSEQHIDFAGTAENITAGTNEHHFTFRVDDIPSSAFGTSMTIAPYITGNIDGEVQTVYLQEKTISVNGMIAVYEAMNNLSAQQKLLISAFKTHYGIA